ncbi:MAG: hypothetical protein FWF24_02840 [Alphaproteobacteria bacterium]|nr:hypothetical protein [Alphaproteobacteria bacterium]
MMKNGFKKLSAFLCKERELSPPLNYVEGFTKGFVPNAAVLGAAGPVLGLPGIILTTTVVLGWWSIETIDKEKRKTAFWAMGGGCLSLLAASMFINFYPSCGPASQAGLQKAAQELFVQCPAKDCAATVEAGSRELAGLFWKPKTETWQASVVEMAEHVMIMKVTDPHGGQQCYFAEKGKVPVQIGNKCDLLR